MGSFLGNRLDVGNECTMACTYCGYPPVVTSDLPLDAIRTEAVAVRAGGTERCRIAGKDPVEHPQFDALFQTLSAVFETVEIETSGRKLGEDGYRPAGATAKNAFWWLPLLSTDSALHDRIVGVAGHHDVVMGLLADPDLETGVQILMTREVLADGNLEALLHWCVDRDQSYTLRHLTPRDLVNLGYYQSHVPRSEAVWRVLTSALPPDHLRVFLAAQAHYFPLCSVPRALQTEYLAAVLATFSKPMAYNDTSLDGLVPCQQADECVWGRRCPGVQGPYVDHYGWEAVRPEAVAVSSLAVLTQDQLTDLAVATRTLRFRSLVRRALDVPTEGLSGDEAFGRERDAVQLLERAAHALGQAESANAARVTSRLAPGAQAVVREFGNDIARVLRQAVRGRQADYALRVADAFEGILSDDVLEAVRSAGRHAAAVWSAIESRELPRLGRIESGGGRVPGGSSAIQRLLLDAVATPERAGVSALCASLRAADLLSPRDAAVVSEAIAWADAVESSAGSDDLRRLEQHLQEGAGVDAVVVARAARAALGMALDRVRHGHVDGPEEVSRWEALAAVADSIHRSPANGEDVERMREDAHVGLLHATVRSLPATRSGIPAKRQAGLELARRILALRPDDEAASRLLERLENAAPGPEFRSLELPVGTVLSLPELRRGSADAPGVRYVVYADGATLDVVGDVGSLRGPYRMSREHFTAALVDGKLPSPSDGTAARSVVIVPASAERRSGAQRPAVGAHFFYRAGAEPWTVLRVEGASRARLLLTVVVGV